MYIKQYCTCIKNKEMKSYYVTSQVRIQVAAYVLLHTFASLKFLEERFQVFPAHARSTCAGPKIVLVPLRSIIYIFFRTWKTSCSLYTLYWKNTLLSNHFRPPHVKWVWFQFSKWRPLNRSCIFYYSRATRQKICTNDGYKDRRCSTYQINDYNVQLETIRKEYQPFSQLFSLSNQIKLRLSEQYIAWKRIEDAQFLYHFPK